MGKEFIWLIGIFCYIIAIVLIIIVLNLLDRNEKKKYRTILDELLKYKNLIINANLISGLNKVEVLATNDEIRERLEYFKKKFQVIKEDDIGKITDSLLEAEDLFNKKKYKELQKEIDDIELSIYYVKTKADFLLKEIEGITKSEEKNRETITKLKSAYRDILKTYNSNKSLYDAARTPLELQFENVDKLFKAFESSMEKNMLEEVSKIVKAIDDTIGNLELIMEEAPEIIMLGKSVIPKKIEDITLIMKKMVNDGYNLDYLNIPYNITESSKKITDVLERLNVLNIEDSLFILRTMSDYFDSIYIMFDKEKVARKEYSNGMQKMLFKITKLTKINDKLLKKLKDIRYSYEIDNNEEKMVFQIKEELANIHGQYDDLLNDGRSKNYSYTHLNKELELLKSNVANVEDKLETTLKIFGSLKEDEIRARDELTEIKELLNNAKLKMKTFKLPTIPRRYFVELSEATEAIGNMVEELEKTPINIQVLNTRVDTARDLVLKFYNTTKELLKTAYMAEVAIVYGNRYRNISLEVDKGLALGEKNFFEGKYKESLEGSINAINIIEPGIYKKLLDEYER